MHVVSRFVGSLAILSVLIVPVVAHACSPVRVLGARELVDGADGIYRVRALEYVPGVRKREQAFHPWPETRVRFKVLETLKGRRLDVLQVPGSLVDHDDSNDDINDDDINDNQPPYDTVRRGGLRGNCFAVSYRTGREYLLFHRGGTPYWAPLSATTEPVSGAQDPWGSWVRRALRSRPMRADPP